MRMAAATLPLLSLLGPPVQEEKERPERFLDVGEWHVRVEGWMRGRRRVSDGDVAKTWTLDRKLLVTFKMRLMPGAGGLPGGFKVKSDDPKRQAAIDRMCRPASG